MLKSSVAKNVCSLKMLKYQNLGTILKDIVVQVDE